MAADANLPAEGTAGRFQRVKKECFPKSMSFRGPKGRGDLLFYSCGNPITYGDNTTMWLTLLISTIVEKTCHPERAKRVEGSWYQFLCKWHHDA